MDQGILDEHQAPDETPAGLNDDGDSYQPTEEEQKTIKLVDRLLAKSKKWRSAYDKDWISNYKWFRGQQWDQQRPSYRHAEVINMIFQAIQSVVPIMTDTRPRFEYMPQDPSDMAFADIVSKCADADWTRNNWLMILTERIYDAHFYGVGYGAFEYDPKGKKGETDIVYRSPDPFAIYPDPNAKAGINSKTKFIVEAEPIDIEEIECEYPELGKFVKPDVMDVMQGEKNDLAPHYQLRIPVDETQSLRSSAGSVEGLLERKALKKICYYLDDETVDVPVTDQLGQPVVGPDGEPQTQKQKKYPNGRKMVVAGGVLLEDGPNPYEDGKFPYSRLVNYHLPREFFGMSEIEQLKSPQRIFNKLVSFTLDVLTLMGNPIWIVDTDAGIDTDNLINKPGLVVEKTKGSEVRREEGVQLQPYVLQLIDRMRDWFDAQAGSSEVSQGIQPGGVTAASAIANLQEAAQTRIRLKSRNLDANLQEDGQMYLSRVLQFRDVPTIMRITNNQAAAEYFKFHVQPMTSPEGEPLINDRGDPVREAIVQQLTAQGLNQIQRMPIKGTLDCSVSTGTSLPFLKAQKSQEAKDFFQMGVIDQEELLKTVDWPNYQAVMQRMQQAAAAAAQAEQASMQAAADAKANATPPPMQPEIPPQGSAPI